MNSTVGFVGIFVLMIVFSACASQMSEPIAQSPPASPMATVLSPNPSPAQVARLYKSIKQVDFKNFTFPWTEEQGFGNNFTLRDGVLKMVDDNSGATLHKVEYGDVTDDRTEEAFVTVIPETGGNCQCEMVYIYTLENEKPKLLWSFDTYDRAEGGLKRVYADKSDLVVETFGNNKYENGKWEFDSGKKFEGLCCPTAFTRIRFTWDRDKFVQKGNREEFDYNWKTRRP